MNIKALLKAMGYLFVPTLAVLTVIFFWFFNLEKFINFITSDGVFASLLRVLILIAEVVLVYMLYNQEKEKLENEELRKKYETEDIYTITERNISIRDCKMFQKEPSHMKNISYRRERKGDNVYFFVKISPTEK